MLVQTIQGSHIQKDIKMKISFPEMETHFNNLQRMFGLLNYQRALPFCKTHVRRRVRYIFLLLNIVLHIATPDEEIQLIFLSNKWSNASKTDHPLSQLISLASICSDT